MMRTCRDRRACRKGCRHRPALRSVAYAGLASLLLVAGLGGVGVVAAASHSPAGSAAPDAGQSLFMQDCASCHGPQALGGLSFGSVHSADVRGAHLRALQPPYSEALLARAIANGVDQRGQTLDPAMPKWKGILSPEQTKLVAAYLWSLGAVPEPATAEQGHTLPIAPIVEGSAMLILIAGVVAATRRWTA